MGGVQTLTETKRVEVRPPWPDEAMRVRHFMPNAFLFVRDPLLHVAVRGRIERLAGSAAVLTDGLGQGGTGWLMLRLSAPAAEEETLSGRLAEAAIESAWSAGVKKIVMAQSVKADSGMGRALLERGFQTTARHELYEISARAMWERVSRIYDRLHAHGQIPAEARITSLQPAAVPAVRDFLDRHMPGSRTALTPGNFGYRPEHSSVLWIRREIKGVMLSARYGRESAVGLRVIAPELRGGLGWANLMLLHWSIGSGIQNGLEVSRFEADPLQHRDTLQFAASFGAKRLGERLVLALEKPAEYP